MKDSLTVRDNRTGESYEIPIVGGAIEGAALARIRVRPEAPGLAVYDPALRNTAICRSGITSLDGHSGELRHGGYRIEDLAAHSTYIEVAYLIFHGELPNAAELESWSRDIADKYIVNQFVTRFLDGFRHDAHPMGILVSAVAAMSTFYPEAKNIHDAAVRRQQVIRLLAQAPTLAAFAHRRLEGLPFAYPDTDLSYVGNFLSMMFRTTELRYEPVPEIERALDVLFILHADHAQSCSTTTMRCVGSAQSDPYSAAAAAAAGLYGRFHGEGFHAVLDMLREIGSVERVPAYLEKVRREGIEPPGFGHRVYRTYDPRARILRSESERLFRHVTPSPYFEVALALDAATEKDEYFIEHDLYPIIDFYEAVMYDAMGFEAELFPVLFALPRFVGWLSQWEEMVSDPAQATYRPLQIYSGPAAREYVPLSAR